MHRSRLSFDVALQGRYFITEKLSIGWQNHAISTSVNKIDTEGLPPPPNMGEVSFLTAGIGLSYHLWGKSVW